jgi:hypothetical protein
MKYSSYTAKGVEIIIEINKKSESGYYLSNNGDLKILDKFSTKRVWQLYLDAKLKGVFVEKYTAISKKELIFFHKQSDMEIEILAKKIPKIPNNGGSFGLALFK